jgi:hypothetical protein
LTRRGPRGLWWCSAVLGLVVGLVGLLEQVVVVVVTEGLVGFAAGPFVTFLVGTSGSLAGLADIAVESWLLRLGKVAGPLAVGTEQVGFEVCRLGTAEAGTVVASGLRDNFAWEAD